MNKITTPEMETVLADHFDPRRNLVVPNVSWGFLNHEADLFVMTKAGYAYEVEIKISLSDLKADAKKSHGHQSTKIKYLYFAIPEYLLEKGLQHIPKRAGVLVVSGDYKPYGLCRGRTVREVRAPQQNCTYKLIDAERYQIARLGALRIWGLKRKIILKERKAS